MTCFVCARRGHDLMGGSPLYIIQEQDIKDVCFKSTSPGQGQTGDCLSEGSLSANLRAYVQTNSSGTNLNRFSGPAG